MPAPKPDAAAEARWQKFLAECIPDAAELSIYQIQRTREIWLAGFTEGTKVHQPKEEKKP